MLPKFTNKTAASPIPKILFWTAVTPLRPLIPLFGNPNGNGLGDVLAWALGFGHDCPAGFGPSTGDPQKDVWNYIAQLNRVVG
jgi:hypothetical protein